LGQINWTIRHPLSVVLHLKSVGIERPDWRAAKLLITALSPFYGAADIFRATNLNGLLKTAGCMPVRADQIFKKTDATLEHGFNFPRNSMAAISQFPWLFWGSALFMSERHGAKAPGAFALDQLSLSKSQVDDIVFIDL
jgi:hypothetical protein